MSVTPYLYGIFTFEIKKYYIEFSYLFDKKKNLPKIFVKEISWWKKKGLSFSFFFFCFYPGYVFLNMDYILTFWADVP